MSFRPISLAAFFPPEPNTKSKSRRSKQGPSASHEAGDDHYRKPSQVSAGAGSSTQTVSSPSARHLGTDSSSERWDDAVTCHSHDHDGHDDFDDEQDQPGLLWGPRLLWVSEEEKFRMRFKRIKNKAEKIGVDKSPFFPRTAGELAGMQADTLEVGARELRAKIAEKEKALRARKKARAEADAVAESWGLVEETLAPVDHGVGEEAAVKPKSADPAADDTDALDPEASSSQEEHKTLASTEAAGGDQADVTEALDTARPPPAASQKRVRKATLLREVASRAAARKQRAEAVGKDEGGDEEKYSIGSDDEGKGENEGDDEAKGHDDDDDDDEEDEDENDEPSPVRSFPLPPFLPAAPPLNPPFTPTPHYPPPTFLNDTLTPVLSLPNNPFTPSYPDTCAWPTTAELTADGDTRMRHDERERESGSQRRTGARGPGLGRFLPVPRLRWVVDPRLVVAYYANAQGVGYGFGDGYGGVVAGWDGAGYGYGYGHAQGGGGGVIGYGYGQGGAGIMAWDGVGEVPWEMRMMVGERWDLHVERRSWERWPGVNRRVEAQEEEEGPYADMVRDLVKELD